MATLHAQVPPRLLPAELGGEGGEYHALTWASTMLNHVPAQHMEKSSSPPPQPAKEEQHEVSSTTAAKPKDNSSFPQTSDCAVNTAADSLSTPLVTKSENAVRSSKSFTSMLFGTKDCENVTNGNSSEEDISLKAH